jgi:hypothetical protein
MHCHQQQYLLTNQVNFFQDGLQLKSAFVAGGRNTNARTSANPVR